MIFCFLVRDFFGFLLEVSSLLSSFFSLSVSIEEMVSLSRVLNSLLLSSKLRLAKICTYSNYPLIILAQYSPAGNQYSSMT